LREAVVGQECRFAGGRVGGSGSEEAVASEGAVWWYGAVVSLERACVLEESGDFLDRVTKACSPSGEVIQPNIWCAPCCDECRRVEAMGWVLSLAVRGIEWHSESAGILLAGSVVGAEEDAGADDR
jgi:hypothetical protein